MEYIAISVGAVMGGIVAGILTLKMKDGFDRGYITAGVTMLVYHLLFISIKLQ